MKPERSPTIIHNTHTHTLLTSHDQRTSHDPKVTTPTSTINGECLDSNLTSLGNKARAADLTIDESKIEYDDHSRGRGDPINKKESEKKSGG